MRFLNNHLINSVISNLMATAKKTDPVPDEKLLNRVRVALSDVKNVKEKRMFSGTTLMVNGKMCISVGKGRLMCRIDPEKHDEAAEKPGARAMVMKGHEYRGFLYVSEDGFKTKKDFDYWVALCLDFNDKAKASPKKKKRS
jgi:TfoX/Sxy family transcriptional regulator of competence genes